MKGDGTLSGNAEMSIGRIDPLKRRARRVGPIKDLIEIAMRGRAVKKAPVQVSVPGQRR